MTTAADNQSPKPPAPLRRHWLQRLGRGLVVLLALVLILLASLSALVQTQGGSRWLLQQLARQLPLQFGEIQGNLIEGLDLGFVDYRDARLHLRIEQPSFRWRLGSLLYGALSIQSLKAEQIQLELAPAPEPAKPSEPFSAWPSLRLPLRIELGHMQLQQIQFRQGATQLSWQSLTGSISLGTFHLRYSDLALDQGDYWLQLDGATDLDFPYATGAKLDWRLAPRTAVPGNSAAFPYEGVGELTGSLRQLQLKAHSSAPVALEASATSTLVNAQEQLLLKPEIQLEASWQNQQLPAVWWFPQQTAPTTSAHLSARGNWEQYRAHLQGELQLAPLADTPQLPPVAISADVEGDYRQLPILQLKLEAPAITGVPDAPPATQRLQLNGRIAWLPALDWQLALAGEELNLGQILRDWPSRLSLNAASSAHLDYGGSWQLAVRDLQLEGSLRTRQLQAKGAFDWGQGRVNSPGLDLVFGANQMHLKGSLGEQLDLHWDLAAPLLGQVDTSLGGSLNSRGQVRGSWRLPQLDGELQAQQLRWSGGALDELSLSLAPAAAATSRAPVSAGGVDTQGLLHTPYKLSASGRRLRLGTNRISLLTLNGEGSVAQHQLTAKLKSPGLGSVDFSLKGGYQPSAATPAATAQTLGQWQGSFAELSLKVVKVPRWELVSSKPIVLSAARVQLGSQCFTTRTNLTAAVDEQTPEVLAPAAPAQSPTPESSLLVGANTPQMSELTKLPPPSLCLNASWQQGQEAQLKARLNAVPLRQFYALFKPEVYLAGAMDGELSLRSRQLSLADAQGKLSLTGRDAELRYQFEGEGTEVYPWRDLALNAELNKGQLSAQAQMQWQGYGLMEADAKLDLPAQKITSSRLQAHFTNLAPLETLIPLANSLSGDLRADLHLSGPFGQPELTGQLHLQQGKARLPRLGVDLSDVTIAVEAEPGGRIALSSALTSGAGQMTLAGDFVSRSTSDWQLQAQLKGENVSLLNTPQLKLDVSPDLNLELEPARLRLTGSALIPWARANIKTLPESTTRVSSDVVIVDDTQDAQAAHQQVQVNVKVGLGEDVTFRGFGLSAKLNGALNLNKDEQRPLLTNGYVGVTQGVYKAYGQNLKIERGRLIFQGPFENPGLDIRAQRAIDGEEDMVAGLEISGTLQRPVAKVYSVPSYSESQAMMMLLSGKPPSADSSDETAALLGALSGLGGDSDNLTSGIASFFRVDELSIKSDKGIDQSQLLIGKYLTPRLLVRYVVGLFDRLTSLGMEYQITDRLRLEAESGEKQSVDVIYKIER